MDIPNTGAIFTLGKSHLAENTQSYFYIKNDAIKRLISGPHQSAVICESGRLFVWGENHYGQLGIGSYSNSGTSGSSINNNNNNNNSSSSTGNKNKNNNNGDIITKPTCVKSLKTLGLKIADIAYGNDWAVILTHSNELFFSGRNIFASDMPVSQNFTEATVANEQCTIIRKPFRLEEFDDCLSKSEETENFVTVLAGNEHFAAMTSFGRLIGWGSNESHQLGAANKAIAPQPHEMQLDAAIQQYACGPESTLVLTASGNLYLTGRLNEFYFPHFTELQKTLSSTEQIIFMHISKASEIFIVTNAGSIYRSIESVRNKTLIFQRFYDYDSEENGPIWKLLKGSSFYTVLTKANKFYTTFSESGHHLKTFREISKFKNLRLLDMAVGDEHILVHGIPRSSTLSATVGPGGEHRFMSRTYVMTAPEMNTSNGRVRSGRNIATDKILEESFETVADANGNEASSIMERKETPKPNTPIHETVERKVEADIAAENAQSTNGTNLVQVDSNNKEITIAQETVKEVGQVAHKEKAEKMQGNAVNEDDDGKVAEAERNSYEAIKNEKNFAIALVTTHTEPKSPTESVKSRKSARSIKFAQAALEKPVSSDKLLRPRTPYPESSGGSTPQTIKKTPLRNYSYEAAMDNDYIERTSPALVDSLENIPENIAGENVSAPVTAIISTPTPPLEEDEQLTVEINTTTDPLDRTIVINEIRFINNGVDVTANVKQSALETEESTDDYSDDQLEEVRREATAPTLEMVHIANEYEDQTKEASEKVVEKIEAKLHEARETVETAAKKAADGARDAADAVGENTKRMANDARHAVETAGSNALKVAGEAKHAVGSALSKVADDTRQAMGAVSTKISNEVQEAKENITSMLQGKAKDSAPEEDDALSDAGSKEGGTKTNTTVGEDDERTTASVNSNLTSGGNPFESANSYEGSNPFENAMSDTVERGKQALRDELKTTEQQVAQEAEQGKSKVRQFFNDIRAKGKGISCRNEKSIRIEDEPPRYTVEDELTTQGPTGHNAGTNQNSSKVCTIL